MVRHHHDSSQFAAALFGAGDVVEKESPPVRSTSNSLSRREEDLFWDRAENGPAKQTQPTDKPPDSGQNSLHFNGTYPPYGQAMMGSSVNPIQMQQMSQQAAASNVNPGMMSASSTNSTIMLPGGSANSHQSPYFPIQVPMPMTGYGNTPIYVIMAPQTGANTIPIPGESNQNYYPRNSPTKEAPVQSAASNASLSSQASTHSRQRRHVRHGGSGDPDVRSKWGERGVGVGHLWSPEEETLDGHRPISTPMWVKNKNNNANVSINEAKEENSAVLPGPASSKQGEKTHTRGSSVVLDSQQMAERQRKLKQAQENQRVIQQQLEEKRKRQQEIEERDRKEAEQMEETLKQQQEKERKQFEEEQNKKREKEEADMKRQEKLRLAIADASERARKDKEKARLERIVKASPTPTDEPKETPKVKVVTPSPSPKKSVRLDVESSDAQESKFGDKEFSEISKGEQQEELRSEEDKGVVLPDLVQTSQLSTMNHAQKIAILRALGVAPDYLQSSGIFDRSSFRSMLNPNLTPTPLLKDEGGDYIRNRVLTPTKFRTARDCGTQFNNSERTAVPPRNLRRRESRRARKSYSLRRDAPGSSPELRPPWGKNQSERPYRKQSEKDIQGGRKIKKKSSSFRKPATSDHGSHTEESDGREQNPPRRRRKTWDMSRAESLSSDFSRSPSPRRRGGGPDIKLPRGPPQIKSPLMPSILKDKVHESSLAHSVMTSSHIRTSAKQQDILILRETPQPANFQFDNTEVEIPPTPYRSNSPPVPALMSKLSGVSSFDVPAYPPGVEPPPDSSRPSSLNKTTSLDQQIGSAVHRPDEKSVTPSEQRGPSARSRTNSLPIIEGAQQNIEESSSPPENKKQISYLRRASLAGGPLRTTEENPRHVPLRSSGKSPRGVSPPSSKPSTPRRLPPMSCPSSPSKSPTLNSFSGGSPSPKPSSGKSSSLDRMTTTQLIDTEGSKITPVEVSPRLNVSSSLISSSAALRLVQDSMSSPNPKKKDSSDSGILSREASRTGSPEYQEEDFKAMSFLSSGYDSYNREISVNDSFNMSDPLVPPDKWHILKSLNSIRQNLWKKNHDLSFAQEPETFFS